MYHRDETTKILCSLCMNECMSWNQVKEGEIELRAKADGLLKIGTELLDGVSGLGDMMIATLHPNMSVKKGDKVCETKVIPLVTKKERMEEAERICGGRLILTILPYRKKEAVIVTTGSEVYHDRIGDAFGLVLMEKIKGFGTEISEQTIASNNPKITTGVTRCQLKRGVNMVLTSGGISVDSDGKTPPAIRNSGVRAVSYGTPMLPGAMFLLPCCEEEGEKPRAVTGLPDYIMYTKRTIFGLMLPRLMTDDMVTVEELYQLGRDGLRMNYEVYHYPNCGFGKG